MLIGAGGHCCGNHAPSLQRYAAEHPDRVRLAAVCDANPERAQNALNTFGFERSFTDIDRMFNEIKIDAAIVVMPYNIVVQMAKRLLPRKIPMTVEKPLGLALPEAEELAEAVKRANGAVSVSLNRRFDPALLRALEWARARGPIRHISGHMLRVGRAEPDFVWGTGIHLLDALCFAAGGYLELKSALALKGLGEARVGVCRGSDSAAGGAEISVSFEIIPVCGRTEERIEIFGNDYRVCAWTGATHPWRIEGFINNELQLADACPAGTPLYLQNGAYNETAAFLDALCEGRPVPASLEEAMRSTRIAAALQDMTA